MTILFKENVNSYSFEKRCNGTYITSERTGRTLRMCSVKAANLYAYLMTKGYALMDY